MSDAKHKEKFDKKTIHIDKDKLQQKDHGCVLKCLGSKMPRTGKKHGSYRKNGYETITGDSEKKAVYNKTFTAAKVKGLSDDDNKEVPWGTKKRKRARKNPSQNPGCWDIANQKFPSNFRYAHTPYNHDFHHIMPMDALIGGSLDDDQVKLLMQAEYNLNDGRNLIILPRGQYFATLMCLPYHASNHPNYIDRIDIQMANINNHLKSGSEIHKDAKAKKTKDGLMNWEDATFKKICEYGAQQLNNRAPDIDGVKIPKIKYNPKK